MASPELFPGRFNISVFTDTEVTRIDRSAQTIAVRDTESVGERVERYDALVLSPGAAPIRPALPGLSLPGVSLDPEMAAPIQAHPTAQGVVLHLCDGLTDIHDCPHGSRAVATDSGAQLAAISSFSPLAT